MNYDTEHCYEINEALKKRNLVKKYDKKKKKKFRDIIS